MPLYDYRCDECEAVMELRHGFHDDVTSAGLSCLACGGVELRKTYGAMPYVSPSATPTRGNAQGIDYGATKKAEKQKPKDMEAYKRLRKNGEQPKQINGSAELEARAESTHEVKSGHLFKSKAGRKRSLGMLDEVLS